MFKGNRIVIKQAKNIGINDFVIRSKYPSEGFRILCLDQSPLRRYFNRTRVPEYPAVKELPLPSNIEDLASSEKLKFSPQRNREINGSFIKFSSPSMTKYKEAIPKLQEDERIQCYDCSGTINLSSAMQTNVPFPFQSRGKPTHLNMPGGQWAQNQKYTSEDLNNVHHSNCKNSPSTGGISSIGIKINGKNSLLTFSVMDLRTCDCLQYSFNVFSNQRRNFCTQKEKIVRVGVDKESDENADTQNVTKLSRKEKLKAAVRDYGTVILVFHIGISLISLGCCYCLVVSGVDLASLLKDWGIDEGAIAAGNAAQFIVAYAVHKTLAPARIAFTLSVAPFVVTKLRKIGLLKPLKKK